MIQTQFDFSENKVAVRLDLGKHGKGVRVMFYFHLSGEVWATKSYKVFEQGKQGAARQMDQVLEVKVDGQSREAMAIAFDKAVLAFYKNNVLAEQLQAAQNELARLINLSEQMIENYTIKYHPQ